MPTLDKLKALLNAFIDWFTMKNARHNRALRDLMYLLKSVQDFLTRYRLQEDGSDFNTVFKNMGQIRIDAVEIAYQTGLRIRRAKNIKDKDLPPLVEEVYNGTYSICLCDALNVSQYNTNYTWYVNVTEFINASNYNQSEVYPECRSQRAVPPPGAGKQSAALSDS